RGRLHHALRDRLVVPADAGARDVPQGDRAVRALARGRRLIRRGSWGRCRSTYRARVRRLVALALLLGSLAGQDLTVAAGDARVGPQVVAAVQAMAEDGLRRLARHFPGAPERPIRVVVHSARDTLPPELREHLHEGTAGFALLGRDEAYVLLAE